PHLIILTSVPSLSANKAAHLAAKKAKSHLAKRQFIGESDSEFSEFSTDSTDSTDSTSDSSEEEGYSSEFSGDDVLNVFESVAGAKFADNATSIFEPNPRGGLLSRYVFFTPALILCAFLSALLSQTNKGRLIPSNATIALLISIFILIPMLVFSISAITSTETVAGLESKMTGTVGLDPAKA
ncbi:hypothetical protein P7C70_g2766, partial [Phenoliferia sp. Uapishka_3]